MLVTHVWPFTFKHVVAPIYKHQREPCEQGHNVNITSTDFWGTDSADDSTSPSKLSGNAYGTDLGGSDAKDIVSDVQVAEPCGSITCTDSDDNLTCPNKLSRQVKGNQLGGRNDAMYVCDVGEAVDASDASLEDHAAVAGGRDLRTDFALNLTCPSKFSRNVNGTSGGVRCPCRCIKWRLLQH